MYKSILLLDTMTSIYTSKLEYIEPRARQLMESHPQDDGTDDDNLASSVLSTHPKLSTRSIATRGINQSEHDEIWSIRKVPTGEEQLYARGRCAYHTRNSILIKSFNFSDQVTRLFWAEFNGTDHVCIALTSGLSIFDHTGRHSQMLLPFSYKEMYTTQLGLIIERSCDLASEDTSLPILFALTHPTREISPVIFKPSTRTTQHSKILTYSMPSSMSIVCCHDTLPLFLIYNSQECQHSIWSVRPITDEELIEFNRQNEDSTGTHANTFSQSSCSFKTLEGFSHSSLNLSSKQRSSLNHQSSSTATLNFSPKLDPKSRQSVLGNLAASRLGAGLNQVIGDQATTNVTSHNVRSFKESLNTNVSTPHRNRMINYLRDNIEEPIMPELTLEQVWTDSTNNSLRATKFFSSVDLIDDEYLVIVIPASSQVKIMRCDKKIQNKSNALALRRSVYIQAMDASPLTALRMMIVMDATKNFVLYTGFDRISSIHIPQSIPPTLRGLASSSPSNIKHPLGFDMSPIQTSSARKRVSMGERSSVGSDFSFHQIIHKLSPVHHPAKEATSSPVCLGDSRKIEHVIGQSLYLISNNNTRARVDIPSVCQTDYVRKLLNAMKSLVSRELGLTIITSWYQTRRSCSQPEFIKAEDEMNLFKNWFLSCLGIDYNFSTKSTARPVSPCLAQPISSKKIRRLKDATEDFMMTPLNYEISFSLTELLVALAYALNLESYQIYYWSKFPHLKDRFGLTKAQFESFLPRSDSLFIPAFFARQPPSAMDLLTKMILLSQMEQSKIEDTLSPYPNIKGVTLDTNLVISLFCKMFGLDIENIIVDLSSTSTNYRDQVSARPFRSSDGDRQVVELLVHFRKDRNYLSRLPSGLTLYLWDAILNCRECPPSHWCEACYNLIGRMDLVDLVGGRSKATRRGSDDETMELLFPDDIRVSEAQRMLASDCPVEFSLTQRQGATEDESRDETHRHLYLLNVRTMAMPLGRGAICLRTYSPVIGESFEVPRLELSSRSITEDRPIEYNHDLSVYPWPFFHNGVAAGLTICVSTSSNIIDSTWINYNRPRSNIPYGDVRDRDLTAANITNEHAGFLFALGLNGHLEKLTLMALHDYLCKNNDLTKLAILLGMSAAKRGSCDTNIIKVLSIHVDALLPPNSTELDVSAPVHAASIIGVGLLYQGSADSHISRVLLEEIGRLPGPEANSHIDRESYSLSAGLAFGLVNLCKGGSTTISSSDQLRLYMLGGKRKRLTIAKRQRYLKQDCHRGEEDYINTHITSPGGTLALGLMYHRSENISVANWMRAPDTQTLLEYVRPDFLILRLLSYGLIMWNEVKASESYIESHIPKIVSTHAFQRQLTPSISDQAIDYELISQAYCYIVAGCCMAIAMRFAGTADKDAYRTIYKHTKMMIALSNKPVLAEQAGRPCIESCLNVLITSLAVVMAGTGDLGVMRICRYLRSRLTQNCVFYGSHMAVHMALGILFLGSCRYSFGTSPEAVGALICALYPIYPNHSSDNRYHLQALRHLYVLAAEPRLLIPRDISTNQPVYVNVILQKRDSEDKLTQLKLRLPCLVPEVDTIDKVSLDDDRYWRIEISDREVLRNCLLLEHGYLTVKQKANPSNNQLVKDAKRFLLLDSVERNTTNLKTLSLENCVELDRVEQFSALNKIINDSKQIDEKYLCLLLEQLFIAKSLASLNSLQPIIDEILERCDLMVSLN